VSAVLVLVPLPSAAEPQKPNIVFILVDNLGWGQLGVYGGVLRGAPTPRIDKLAGEGLKLLNFPKEFDMSYDRNQPVLDALPGRSP
jgi:hypothetical protein